MWNKILGYLVLAGTAFVSGLLILLKLKEKKIKTLESSITTQRFGIEDEKSESELSKLRKEFNDAKNNLHSDSDKQS